MPPSPRFEKFESRRRRAVGGLSNSREEERVKSKSVSVRGVYTYRRSSSAGPSSSLLPLILLLWQPRYRAAVAVVSSLLPRGASCSTFLPLAPASFRSFSPRVRGRKERRMKKNSARAPLLSVMYLRGILRNADGARTAPRALSAHCCCSPPPYVSALPFVCACPRLSRARSSESDSERKKER